jgi:regulator of protease activity HflC (stomatin/prohibitin superfamily)
MFFPPSIQIIVLDNLLRISSLADLQQLVNTWRHCDAHSPALYDAIVEIRTKIAEQREEARLARNAAARKTRAAKRKAAELSDDAEEEEEEEEEEESSEVSASEGESDDIFPAMVPIPQKRRKSATGRKQPALKTVTNTKCARVALPSPLTLAKIAQDYCPQYKPRVRREL